MNETIDLHIHLLPGVDDGAKDEAVMRAMLDASYADGVRVICATPHFHPGYFGDNAQAVTEAFERLREAVAGYEGLEVMLGSELRYSPDCTGWLNSGRCRTLNGGHYLLVDFSESEKAERIVQSLFQLLNAGYRPVLAHAERYVFLHGNMRELGTLHDSGALIQLDAASLLGCDGLGARLRSRRILKAGLCDLVASDAHNMAGRPPCMGACRDYVTRTCGPEAAERLFNTVPRYILDDMEMQTGKDGYDI